MRIKITENVEFQSDPILMLLCFVKGGVTHENFIRELCLFYKALNDLSIDARSSRDLMMYLVEIIDIMILLYLDIMTYDIVEILYNDTVIDLCVSSRSYDIIIVLYCDIISSRYNRSDLVEISLLTNWGFYGKMPPALIFSRGGLDIFSRLCYNTPSKITRIQRYKRHKNQRIQRDYKRYKDYKTTIKQSYNTTIIQETKH